SFDRLKINAPENWPCSDCTLLRTRAVLLSVSACVRSRASAPGSGNAGSIRLAMAGFPGLCTGFCRNHSDAYSYPPRRTLGSLDLSGHADHSLRHSYGQRSALPRSTRSAPAWMSHIHDCNGSGFCWIGIYWIQPVAATCRVLSTKYQVPNTDLRLQSCVRNYSSCKEGPRRMDISYHDVLLLGGGGAGLRAAIAVSEVNPDLSVAVVSKVYPMRSHTVSAEGGAAGVIKQGDTFDDHAYDTI